MKKGYLKFELGMSGTGLPTACFNVDVYSETDIKLLITTIITGLFVSDEHEWSSRYLKVTGENGSIQWGSKKIQSHRPSVDHGELPSLFIS